jgi:hypothetical protein
MQIQGVDIPVNNVFFINALTINEDKSCALPMIRHLQRENDNILERNGNWDVLMLDDRPALHISTVNRYFNDTFDIVIYHDTLNTLTKMILESENTKLWCVKFLSHSGE